MKELQNGRSMIEMLGVLAIIGVLSIGGLAGYTMAMNRHRANQILDFASRCVVVAQTSGDGSTIRTGACGTILGETVPAAIQTDTGVALSEDGKDITVTLAPATEKIGKALENRSTGDITITADGVFTFKGAGAGMTGKAVSSGSVTEGDSTGGNS